MALSLSGTGQSLAWGSAIATAAPISLSCWVNMNAFTTTPVLMVIGDSTNNNVFEMVISSAGKPIAQTSLAGSAAQATSGQTVSTGVWTMITAVFASATSRIIYVNGGNAVSNATSKIPSGINNSYIGAVGTSHLMNGIIAYPTFWNIALSATDVAALYNGGSGKDPSKVQSANVLNFPKLQSGPPYVDSVSSSNWTVTGSPTVVADPFSLVNVGLTGICTGNGANSVALTVSKPLGGTCTAKAANSGRIDLGFGALNFNGSSQYLTQSAVVISFPFSMSCWFKPATTVPASQALVSLSANSGANNYFMLVMVSGGTLRAQQSTAGTIVNAGSGATMVAGTWYHCVAVFSATNNRFVYLNAVQAQNTTSNTGGTINTTAVGINFQGTSTPLNFANGVIAYPTWWNTALTQTDVNALYAAGAGFDPEAVKFSNEVSFSFLRLGPPYPDQRSGNNWSVVGAPTSDFAPFLIINNLAVNCAAAAANSGSLRVPRAVTGACTVQGANIGNFSVSALVNGACTAHGANSGALGVSKALSVACIVSGAHSGRLNASLPLHASCTAHANISARLGVLKALRGSGIAHASVIATLGESDLLRATGLGHAAISGVLFQEQILEAVATFQAASTGTILAPKLLTVICDIHLAAVIPLSVIGNPKPLAIHGLAHGASRGDLFIPRSLEAIVTGRAANTGSYEVYQELEGRGRASGSILGDLYMEVIMTAACVIHPAETGVYLSQTDLYASLSAVFSISADLTNILFIFGRNAIELQLFTQQFTNVWVPQNPATLVKYSNRNFTAPTSGTYVEFGVDSGRVDDIALGGLVQRGMGEVHLDIYSAENSGTMTMRILADAFADCFDRVNFQYNNGLIWTRRAEILRGSPIQGWSRWRVVVPFKHDQFDVPVLELA